MPLCMDVICPGYGSLLWDDCAVVCAGSASSIS